MKKPRVLMLGWEFPPVINGGLGIACLGLSKALSNHAKLSFILPKSSSAFRLRNVELIGLNNLDLEKLKGVETKSFYEAFSEIEEIETELLPYYSCGDSFENTEEKEMVLEMERLTKEIKNPFRTGDLYGEDIKEKVVRYTDYATRIALQKNFDVIHCHDWMTFMAGVRIKELTGKPLVLHIHSLEYDRAGFESRSWLYHVEKWAMEKADLVLPVSNYTGEIATSHYDIAPSKICPVHNGADPVFPFKSEKPFPEKLVLFLGRLTRQKGPDFFLNVAEQVIAENKNVRFVMAGTGDKMKELILKGASKTIGTKFHFTGFLNKPQVNQLLSMTDVYCMPSISEPFGLSALEAAQFGIPCVISKQSGVAEVLSGSLKADFWDVKGISGHINTVLEDQKLRKELVAEAFENLKDCTWAKAAEKVKKAYSFLNSTIVEKAKVEYA